ncbi:MAG: CHAT domain-containing protein [Gammaproteobacteria bacterium]
MALEAVAELRGKERKSWDVRLPTRSTVIAVVEEDGLDLTLDVSQAGRLVGRAENPVPRHGVQRIVFTTSGAAGYVITVAGKEHGEVQGKASVRVTAIPESVSRHRCVAVLRTLAAGDASYASAQAATETAAGQDTSSASAYRAAVTAYRNAAALLASSQPSLLLAQSRHAEAVVLQQWLQDWVGAKAAASAAALSYQNLDAAFGRAEAAMIEAQARIELAAQPRAEGSGTAAEELAKVRDDLKAIAAFHSKRGERYEQALALNNMGLAFHQEGRFDDAIRSFRRAALLYDSIHETPRKALALQNIAAMEYELGRFREAIPHYREVLTLIRKEDDPLVFASSLNNSAMASWSTGDHDTALRGLGEALSILQGAQDSYFQAVVLHNLGCVYDALGDQDRALDFYRQALKLRTADLDPSRKAASLRTIGNVLRERGRRDEALKMHQEALALASGAAAKSRMRVQIARDLGAMGRTADALHELEPVLTPSGSVDEVIRARALAVRGQFTAPGNGAASSAERDLKEAIALFHRYELPVDEFEAWLTLARRLRTRGAADAALVAVDEALELAEEVRLQSANPELRATLLQPLRPAFDLKIALLAERYFAASGSSAQRERIARLALSTAERSRARALADFQNLDVSAPGVPAELARQRQTLYRDLAARRSRLATMIDRAGTDDVRVRAISGDIASLRRQLDEIDARIGVASNKAADASSGTAGGKLLKTSGLPADTGVIEYWLGGEASLAWSVSADSVLMVRLGASDAIAETARSFYTALRSFGSMPEERRLSLGAQLHDLIIKPLGAEILNRRRLVFVPDGALHYIPFAAVRSGAKFLIETHDISVTPSIEIFLNPAPGRRRESPTREMLVVADPVYGLDDPRLARPAGSGEEKREGVWPLFLTRGAASEKYLARLPGSAREAASIVALFPGQGVDRLEGFTATRDGFLSSGLSRYRFIHVASHAIADADVPQASALILSRFDSRSREIDGRVLAADFVNVQINAQAVVLSACDTALGKNISGEGLVGLRYVVLSRGAQAVISSLWPVADQVSAELMARFYTALLRDQSRVSPALSDAMRAAMTGRFRDPGLWAAYVLTVADLDGA